ncbi:hypothetical protein FSARC_1887 [Fusarium sarcochroum]|uniref:Poly A polymerase head domain-containing protein n=1 Tax=Fusarium sarcochroum TaxID=1208366 RepID=A0A8H4XE94_9HYPO|nr:hypothetical protein FSARC_1887 [Fusarium sarcochroum]
MKRNLDTFLKEQSPLAYNSAALSTSPSLKHPPSPSRVPKITMVTTTIQLTPKEQQLRRLLLDVAKSIDDDSGHAPEPIILRWAGGWVRDKLLNIQSHDIDVAINAMTGVSFAQAMCNYCEQPEAMAKHSIGPADIGSLHNVARNPEKSKHLETAMVKMFGLDLDFVNLRKETYTEDSRNPQMEFGTACEDASRRDATVNALFYNLHDDRVEDFTRGLADMDAKIIRTPLEPFKTFMDDPLRVLRLVRFASRLQFTLDADTRKYMADPKVLEALRVKISRERVGVELEKMLKGWQQTVDRRTQANIWIGAHPHQAIEFIDELQLFHAIFTDPTQENLPAPDISRWSVAYTCLDELLQDQSSTSVAGRLVQSADASYSAWNLAALSPWMTVEEPPNPRKKANALPLVAVVSREGFKAPNRLSDIVAASHRHREEIMTLKNAVCNGESYIGERDRFGVAIRKWDSPAGTWRLQVLNALLVDVLETLSEWRRDGSEKQKDFLRGWNTFLDHLAELDVYEAPSLKRLLDGRQLAKALDTKPGKWTGQALEELHETTLLVAAYLSTQEQKDLGSSQVEVLVKFLSEKALILETGGEDTELLTEAAIACLSILSAESSLVLDENTLLKLTAITDPRDPWTTTTAATVASRLLSEQLTDQKLADFIVITVLQKTLKPLFTKPSSRITASGRPSQYAVVEDRSQPISEVQPWTTQAPWVEATMQWAVDMSTASLIQQHWPLFMPVLLALVENETIEVKVRGLGILTPFVSKCPAQVLKNTGIGRVFGDVTFPLLLYLPSVTPEDQSTSILIPAYDVLIKLAESSGNPDSLERRQLFDKILRDGIFAGHFHASQHTRIVEVLMQKTAAIVKCLGIYSTKHLRPLLSMTSSVMADPFATSYPPTLITATQTLGAIITNAWPRIREDEHMEHVVRILSLCWLNVSEDIGSSASRTRGDDAQALSKNLLHTAKILQTLWTEDDSKRPAQLNEALEQEPRLSELFPAVTT